MIKHYVTLAFRNLLRNKFQSLFSILGLAVAFFCFIALAIAMLGIYFPAHCSICCYDSLRADLANIKN